MKTNLLTIIISGFLFLFLSQNAKAATYNWIGTYNSNFNQANNWYENAVPGNGDIAQIGVSYIPTINTPVIGTAGTTSISSLVFGGKFINLVGTNNIGITVNSGSTLSISGDITFPADNYPTILNSYYISGSGTIKATNMNINANYGILGTLLNAVQQVNCSVNNLVLSGNLALISEEYKVLIISYSETAYFNLTGGTTEIDGYISTSNTIAAAGVGYPASYVVINPSSSAGATLQLNGGTALSGLSSSGTNYITFNNTYATVNYAGSVQKVYTNPAPNAYGGVSYYNLTVTGTSTETPGSGTLTVSNDLNLIPTAAMTFNLNANSTVSAIHNFSSNTLAILKQGSGQNFVVADSASNAGTINLVGNSTMLFNGTTGLTNTGTINGLSGYGSQQNIVVTAGPLSNSGTINWYGISGTYASTISVATLSNSGKINMLAQGTVIVVGQATNSGTINKTDGVFNANTGFTNTASGIFKGTTTTGTSGYTYFTGAFINNDSLKCNAETIFFNGNYTNNAFFTAGSGMVYFSGSAQTLVDNSTRGTVFNNVTFNGSGTATMTSGTGNFGVAAAYSLYMVSPAKLIAGSTTVGGAAYLTIMSNTTSSATVYTPSGTSITGNVNVQRFISNGSGTRGYRLLTSPVNISLNTAGSGNLGLSYLGSNLTWAGKTYYGAFTEGPGTGFTTNGSTNPIIYLYDESRPTDNSSFVAGKNIGVYSMTNATGSPAYSITTLGGKPAATTPGINVPVANSYLFYFVGSDQSTMVSSSRTPDSTTLTASGYLNQGNVPVKFWKTGSTAIPYDVTTGTTYYGINQVGNPYASSISINTLYTDNYNATTNPIGSAFYELIPGGNYVSYNASNGHVSDTRASQYIVSGQGFLAQATATGQTLTFMEDQKVAYNATATLLESIPVKPVVLADNITPSNNNHRHTDAMINPPANTTPENNAGLHLQLTKDNTDYAQTGIYFSKKSADNYNAVDDAAQVDGGTPVLYLSSYSADGTKLSINSMGDYSLGKRVKLYINANTSGTYNMSLADITSIDTNTYSIYLIDNQKLDSIDIVHHKTIAIDINPYDTTSVGGNRFVLAIDHKPIPKYVLATFNGQKVTSGVKLNWTAVNAGNYTGYILQKLNNNGGYDSLYAIQSDTSINAYSFVDTHPIIGNNTYRLAQNGYTGNVTYSANVTVGYSSTTPGGALTLYPNPASTVMNVNLAAGSINTPAHIADIYDSMGVRVSQQTISGTTWTNDVSSYKHGIYVMQVKDINGNIIGTAKFIKVQ